MTSAKQNSYTLCNVANYLFNYNNQNEQNFHPNDALNANNERDSIDVISRFSNNTSKIDDMIANRNLKIPHDCIANTTERDVNRVTEKRKINGHESMTRIRTIYEPYQIIILEKEYAINRYIGKIRKFELAEQLNVSERHIKTWFQNRRMKEKKKTIEDIEISSTEEEHNQIGIDQLHTNQTPLTYPDGEVRMTGPNECTHNIKGALTIETSPLLNPTSEHYKANPLQQFHPSTLQQIRQKEFLNQSNYQHPENSSNTNFISYRHNMDFMSQMTQMPQRKPNPIIQQSYCLPNKNPPTYIQQGQARSMQLQNVDYQNTQQFCPTDVYEINHQTSKKTTSTSSKSPSRILLECDTLIMSNSTSPHFHNGPSTTAFYKTETKRQTGKCNKDNVIDLIDHQTLLPMKEAITVKQNENLNHNAILDNDNLVLAKHEKQQIKKEHLLADEYDSDIEIVEPEIKNNVKLDDVSVVNNYFNDKSRKNNSLLSRLVFEDD